MTWALLGALLCVRAPDVSAADGPRASKVCLDCHDGRDKTLADTGHQLPSGDLDAPDAMVACTDCHGNDRRHWEEDAEKYPMTIPSKVDAIAEARICSACHQNSHQQNMAERNVHMRNDVNCSACHSVHESKHPALLRQAEVTLCLGCHTDVQGQFAKPYRHPVDNGIVKCSECHITLDETRRELTLNGTNVCTKCHAEMQGPFPYEHQATLDFSTEEGGCLSCHQPHGSYLPRMLNQPYEAPHFQLCTQCHSYPPGHLNNMNHGTLWAGKACNDCHVDIHGSYDNRLFVNEDLKSQGCFKGGCHSLR
jgi:DmsE family decaheme c-type cytochrome